ncbi:MAG: putative sigma regulatory protein MucB/RseB [Bryobacterales bacterium]|nr:putative sigma regulatory protein MucB/RseB [Bryobacterales bacterium]
MIIVNLTPRLEGATNLKPEEVISGIDKSQQIREEKLAGYTAIEQYTVYNSHFAQTAELTARVRYQKRIGKRYEVLSRKGPRFLEERVLRRILKEDAQLSRNAERSHTLLTSSNYSMNVTGTQTMRGKLCYVISIHPRSREFSLIEGTAWVDVKDLSLLRIEGKPAASPSFWTGQPLIEREYTIIDGLSFPHHSRATSKGFFGGKSQLDINYSQYLVALSP